MFMSNLENKFDELQMESTMGSKPIAEPKVLFASIAKNIEPYFETVRRSFELFQTFLPASHIVIFENNSDDASKELLTKWSASNSNVHIQLQHYSEDFIKTISKARNIYNEPCQLELTAWARNQLLEMIEKDDYADFSHVVMFDFNTKQSLPVQNLYNCLMRCDKDYDVVVCNSINSDGSIIDGFNMRTEEYPYGPEVMGDMFWRESYQKLLRKNFGFKDEFIPILSGFNSLAIFKKSSIYGVRYSALPTKELDEFYRLRSDFICKKASYIRHGNPLGMFVFPNKSIFYLNSTGFNMPVVSPHVNFFMQMAIKGHSRIFLYPRLFWRKYSSITGIFR